MPTVLLSQTSKYAVRAAIHLAQHREEGPGRVAAIAEQLGIPRNYLSKILHQLARAGILDSERGPRGGFRLTAAPEALTLYQIVEPVDAGFLDRRCLLGRPECSDRNPCPAHGRWAEVADEIESFLTETTLADLLLR